MNDDEAKVFSLYNASLKFAIKLVILDRRELLKYTASKKQTNILKSAILYEE